MFYILALLKSGRDLRPYIVHYIQLYALCTLGYSNPDMFAVESQTRQGFLLIISPPFVWWQYTYDYVHARLLVYPERLATWANPKKYWYFYHQPNN